MSGYNCFESCSVCYCHDCQFRKVKCGPCMDCEGIPDDQVNKSHSMSNGNGYIPKSNPNMCDIIKNNKSLNK